MHLCVAFALICALRAYQRAGLQHSGDQLVIRSGAPGGERCSHLADVRAIEIKPYALPKPGDVFLAQAGISTHAADLRAVQTLIDTGNEPIVRASEYGGMRADHFVSMQFAISQGLRLHIARVNQRTSRTKRACAEECWSFYRMTQRGIGPRKPAALQLRARQRSCRFGPLRWRQARFISDC
jgi:hypothetical protein